MEKLLNFFAKIFNEGKTSEDLLAVLGYTLYWRAGHLPLILMLLRPATEAIVKN